MKYCVRNNYTPKLSRVRIRPSNSKKWKNYHRKDMFESDFRRTKITFVVSFF